MSLDCGRDRVTLILQRRTGRRYTKELRVTDGGKGPALARLVDRR